ncbi:unnamed protein product [Orchesella dallaii]|uniref:Odorant receptor n=1 Tax=Orchesella dallaii TaxID=48710 RepID=A0ABP1RMF0_9HEXA
MAHLNQLLWINMPILWVPNEITAQETSRNDRYAWNIFQALFIAHTSFILLLVTGTLGVRPGSEQTLVLSLATVLYAAAIVSAYTVDKHATDVVVCLRGLAYFRESLESYLGSLIGNRKYFKIITEIVIYILSSMLLIIPVIMSFTVNYLQISVTFPLVQRILSSSLHVVFYYVMNFVLEFLIISNFLYTLSTYLTILTMFVIQIILAQYFILRREHKKFIRVGIAHGPCMNFRRAYKIYRAVQIFLIFINEIGEYVHPTISAIGLFAGVVSGSVTILGSSRISMPPLLYPLFPAVFTGIMVAFIILNPAAAMIQQNSVMFKFSWKLGISSRIMRKQLVSCREERVEMKGIGFIDQYYIMSFLNGMLINIVNLVVYVTTKHV